MILIHSDPTMLDTDGDLFPDSINNDLELKGYYLYDDSNPLKSDVYITKLSRDLFSVKYEKDPSAKEDWSTK